MSRESYLESCERMLRRILELQSDPRINAAPFGKVLGDLGLSEMPLTGPIEMRYTISGGPYPVARPRR